MKTTRKVALVVATMAAGLPLAISAGSASSAPSPSALASAAVSESAAAAAAAYWTPARMASATPLDMSVPAGSPQANASAEAAGAPGSVAGVSVGGGGTSLSLGNAEAAFAVPKPYTNYPDKTNGKVFFTKRTGGNFVCSGTAVNSEDKSIVWTAGHCVFPGGNGGAHLNWVFVPAYSSSFNGHRPYGTWTAREMWSLNGWIINSQFAWDQGAVVVNRVGGIKLVNRIGGQGIAWNQPTGLFRNAFGYPQAAPFNGWTQWRCNGVSNTSAPTLAGTMKLPLCNLTGGSSGGGWLINLPVSGLGWVNGVNSYKFNNDPNSIYSPYFGSGTLNLYNAVRNRPS